MSPRFARDILLKRKWSEKDLAELTIFYISRGSPGNISQMNGSEIEHIGRSFLELLDGTMIPFHRVNEIRKGERTIWKRNEPNRP